MFDIVKKLIIYPQKNGIRIVFLILNKDKVNGF